MKKNKKFDLDKERIRLSQISIKNLDEELQLAKAQIKIHEETLRKLNKSLRSYMKRLNRSLTQLVKKGGYL